MALAFAMSAASFDCAGLVLTNKDAAKQAATSSRFIFFKCMLLSREGDAELKMVFEIGDQRWSSDGTCVLHHSNVSDDVREVLT